MMDWRKRARHALLSVGVVRDVARAARRTTSLLRMPRALLAYHSGYRAPENPFSDPRRAARVLDYLMNEGCVHRHHVLRPRRASIRQLNLVHPYEYLSAVGDPSQLERVFGQDVFEVDASAFVEQQRWMVGGTIRAARAALSLLGPRTTVNLGGGLHHAYRDAGYGFCVFNDVAVAIRQLRQDGYTRRILVVDLDLHQGDGTRSIFAEDDSVFTLSLHAENWDTTEIPRGDLSVALGHGVGDDVYLRAIRDVLPEAFERARPHLVFYLAGVDVAADDRLGNWRVSADALLERDRMVMRHIGHRPSVWLMAGGYGPDAWRYTARSLADLLSGYDAPIPSSSERQLDHFRSIANTLSLEDLTHSGKPVSDNFDIQPDDLYLDLTGPKTPSKVLGFYSPYGIECALERYGVIPHIRKIGIPRVELTTDTEHATGHLLRLHSDDERRDLLVEIVLAESHKMPPFRLLWLEWLMAQNPRSIPTRDRPLLPGQKHPGLGCLVELVGMLVMAAERLDFDGLAFNPAHYHVAVLGKPFGMFADPVAQARFDAISAAVAGMSLAAATLAIADGEVFDASSGKSVRWEPSRVVVPSSERMREYFAAPDWTNAVAKAGQGLSFRCRRSCGAEAVAIEADAVNAQADADAPNERPLG